MVQKVHGDMIKDGTVDSSEIEDGTITGDDLDATSDFSMANLNVAEYIKHTSDTDTYIRFTSDDINIQAGGVDFVKITEDTQNVITFNEGGADIDFIVESPNESKAIYLHAGNEVLHINHGESNFQTKIHNDNDIVLTVNNTGAVFNEDSHASIDFRVESDGEDEAIFLDASANTLYVNKGATAFTTIIKNNNEEAIRVGASGIIFNEYSHASMDFRVESDSDTHMLFVDAGSNRVGIGTDSPAVLFHVDGAFQADTAVCDTVACGGSADALAVATLTSTTKGFLPPRMTSTQRDAISSPPEGLMVYDSTNNEPNYYNGSAWKQMDGTSAGSSVSYSSVDVRGSSSYSSGSDSGWPSSVYACSYGGYHSTTPQTDQSWYRSSSPATPEQLYSNSSGTAVSLSSGHFYYRIISSSVYKYFINGSGQVYTADGGTAIQIDNTELTGC